MSHGAQAPLHASAGWNATLSLSFESGPSRPIVRRKHSGPLSIQRPFYPEESVAHVYLLHPPGGVVGGDALSINASAEAGAAGLVTTPGATKFYRSNGLTSSFRQTIEVQGGSLEWFPQENIFFDACSAELVTTVDIQDSGALAFWDIQCFGRPAGNLPFMLGSVSNKLTVMVQGIPVFMDRLVVDEAYPLSRCTSLRAHSVLGTFLMNNMSTDALTLARNTLNDMPEFCTSWVDHLLLVRYIGDSAQQAKEGFTAVWNQLRYLLNQQSPCPPRIWAT